MSTVRIELVATLPRQPSEVFRVVSDPLRQVEWDLGTCRGVEPLTPGRRDKGARYRAHLGRTIVELEVVEYTRDARFTTLGKTREGMRRSTYTFTASPGGTTFTQVDELALSRRGVALGPIARARMGRRQKQIVERLRRYLYAGGGAPE
jgi:Polyketide cyclase / dehydrase and lipid transport